MTTTTPPPEGARLRSIVEAILFAHGAPVTAELLAEALPGVERDAVRAAVKELDREYREAGHSFQIVQVAGGYQICTREEWAEWVVRFQRGKKRVRLSRAAVETLGIVAYRQPVTRADIEAVRGVDSGGVLHTLLERNLIAVKGRAKTVGRPLVYATTTEFLDHFGLDTVDDLPRLEEIEELLKDRAEIIEEVEALEESALPEHGAEENGGDAGVEPDPDRTTGETTPQAATADPAGD